MIRFDHHAQFITITCLNWLPLLRNNLHKEIILEALKHRIENGQVSLYAFVIMPNHLHLIWQLHDGVIKKDFQRDFLKFTSRSVMNFMKMNEDPLLNRLRVKAKDRSHQFWERNSLGIDLYSENILLQKLDHLHRNPIQEKWRLAVAPEDYHFSSAGFYETGGDKFGILTHFKD